jgi:ABC-type glycerol-3-phosphate transport system substrate-binding protein
MSSRRSVALLMVTALVLAACGSDEGSADTTTPATTTGDLVRAAVSRK